MKTYHVVQVKLEYNRYSYTIVAESIDEALDNFLIGTSEVSQAVVNNNVYEVESLSIVEGSEVI